MGIDEKEKIKKIDSQICNLGNKIIINKEKIDEYKGKIEKLKSERSFIESKEYLISCIGKYYTWSKNNEGEGFFKCINYDEKREKLYFSSIRHDKDSIGCSIHTMKTEAIPLCLLTEINYADYVVGVNGIFRIMELCKKELVKPNATEPLTNTENSV